MTRALLAAVFVLALTSLSFSQTSVASFLLAQEPDPYVGSQMCTRCHAEYASSLTGSPHATEKFQALAEHGCQSCHGPGRSHVQDTENVALQPRMSVLAIEARRGTCLACHEDSGHDKEHFAAEVACADCHNVHDWDAGVMGSAGQGRCLSCHASDNHGPASADGFQFHGTPHSTLECASCHSLGAIAESPWEGRAGAETCLGCHGQAHPRFFASSHARAGLSCKSCHSVHRGDLVDDSAPDGYGGRGSQKCIACHTAAAAEFTFNEHHRLEEGIMECMSCHNPHEPTPRVRLGGFKTQQCTQCHLDKLGPFVFEHGTSIVEGCTSCHAPHGSPNRFMLQFQAEGDLCYSCHVIMPGFHSRFTSETMCTSCHASIHGSNLHPAFLN